MEDKGAVWSATVELNSSRKSGNAMPMSGALEPYNALLPARSSSTEPGRKALTRLGVLEEVRVRVGVGGGLTDAEAVEEVSCVGEVLEDGVALEEGEVSGKVRLHVKEKEPAERQ